MFTTPRLWVTTTLLMSGARPTKSVWASVQAPPSIGPYQRKPSTSNTTTEMITAIQLMFLNIRLSARARAALKPTFYNEVMLAL